MQVQSLGGEDPLEGGMATHSSVLAWRIPRTEEPGRLLLLLLSHFSRVRLCETLCTAACQAPPSLGFSRQEYWSGLPCPSPGDLPDPGIEPRSPVLPADSLPAEPQGKPKNTGVGSLSFLQRIFLTQESNWSLLHCRWILYQLSYQGSLENVI